MSYVVIDLPYSIILGVPYCLHVIDPKTNDFEFTSFKEDFTEIDVGSLEVLTWLHRNLPSTCTIINSDLIKEV